MHTPDAAARVPTVSIGLPVFNGSLYLRSALDSLLAQTFSDFEITISDNASTDKTEAICRDYAARDRRIRYVRQESNIGLFPNVEFVMRAARGPFSMLAADDDLYEPTYLERLVALLRSDPNVGLAHSGYDYVSADGQQLSAKQAWGVSSHDSRFRNAVSYMLRRSCLPMIFGVFRTEVFARGMPFVTLGQMTGDIDNIFMVTALLEARADSTPDVLFHYRLKDRTSTYPRDWPATRMRQTAYLARHNARVTRHFWRIIRDASVSWPERLALQAYAGIVFVGMFTVLPLYRRLRVGRRCQAA